jgi:hypothetical protein
LASGNRAGKGMVGEFGTVRVVRTLRLPLMVTLDFAMIELALVGHWAPMVWRRHHVRPRAQLVFDVPLHLFDAAMQSLIATMNPNACLTHLAGARQLRVAQTVLEEMRLIVGDRHSAPSLPTNLNLRTFVNSSR